MSCKNTLKNREKQKSYQQGGKGGRGRNSLIFCFLSGRKREAGGGFLGGVGRVFFGGFFPFF